MAAASAVDGLAAGAGRRPGSAPVTAGRSSSAELYYDAVDDPAALGVSPSVADGLLSALRSAGGAAGGQPPAPAQDAGTEATPRTASDAKDASTGSLKPPSPWRRRSAAAAAASPTAPAPPSAPAQPEQGASPSAGQHAHEDAKLAQRASVVAAGLLPEVSTSEYIVIREEPAELPSVGMGTITGTVKFLKVRRRRRRVAILAGAVR